MKLLLNLSIFLLAFFSLSNKSFSLSDFQIKRFCAKEKRLSFCIKNLQDKRSDLQKGEIIKITVAPYKKWLEFEFKFQILIQKD